VVACSWHPMTALENATLGGFSLETGTTVMPVKCTGLVKVSFLLKLFAKGIEGVLILGCHGGDCHYYNGSERCAKIVEETREILSLAGIPARRLGFDLIADSRGKEFARVVSAFGKQFAGKPSRRAGSKKAAPRKSASRKSAGKKSAGKKAAPKKQPAGKPAKRPTARSKRGV